jgi:hypothetical protein
MEYLVVVDGRRTMHVRVAAVVARWIARGYRRLAERRTHAHVESVNVTSVRVPVAGNVAYDGEIVVL